MSAKAGFAKTKAWLHRLWGYLTVHSCYTANLGIKLADRVCILQVVVRLFPRRSKVALLAWSGLALASAAPRQEPPGVGVLCLGTFIYFVERTGALCRAGQDPEFQARIATYARRFDDYIVRNAGGDPALLARFKKGQNLQSVDPRYICSDDIAASYDHFKGIRSEDLTKSVDKLLARDGPPSFGDCV